MKSNDAVKRNISLEITNVQDISGRKEQIFQTYTGTLVVIGGRKHIYYSEEADRCVITAEKDRMRIVKTPSGSSMVFEKGREYITPYFTPQGRLDMTVYTDEYSDFIDDKGILNVNYRLSVSDTQPVYNQLTIKIKEI